MREEYEAGRGESTGGGFFARLNAIVDGGHLAGLSALEVKALVVYMRHSANDTGEAWPAAATVAAKVGEKNVGRTRKAIGELVRRGLLDTVDAGGGRKRSARRRVTVPGERGTESVPVSRPAKGDGFAEKGDGKRPRKGDGIRPEKGDGKRPRTTHWNNTRNNTHNNGATWWRRSDRAVCV